MKLGFIGLGNIGILIARDLVGPGRDVWVYDVLPAGPAEVAKRGAHVAASPAEIARNADMIGICVRNDKDVHDVVEGKDGILSTARPGLLVLIHSTVRIDTIRDIAAKANAQGVRVVDAPVSRGVNSPPSKGIVFMLGGAPEDVARARTFAELAALKIVEAGTLGSAMALKVCNNLLTYLTMVSANEAIQLAEAAGLNVKLLAEVTANNGVAGPTLKSLLDRRAGAKLPSHVISPPPEAVIGLGEKDLDCALEVGRDFGLKLPAVSLARHEFRHTVEHLWGN